MLNKLSQRTQIEIIILVLFTCIVAVLASIVFLKSKGNSSLLSISNFVGPAADSLLHRGNFRFISDGMGTLGNPIEFSGARMPFAPLMVAGSAFLLGTGSILPIAILKTIALLSIYWYVAYLIYKTYKNSNNLILFALLIFPFLLSPVLAISASLESEEGYAYSLIALAFTYTVLRIELKYIKLLDAAVLSIAIALIYLTKSSYILFCIFLAVYNFAIKGRPLVRILPAFILMFAILGWGYYQLSESGKFNIGTSLDGINLHKGNHIGFLEIYPPTPERSLDSYDTELNKGHLFQSEWEFDKFHKEKAIEYMISEPRRTLEAMLIKLNVFLFSIEKIGNRYHGLHYAWDLFSLTLIRITNIFAILLALFGVIKFSGDIKKISLVFLLTQLTITAPYVLGFAYTRHFSVLIIPTMIFLAIFSQKYSTLCNECSVI